MQSSSKGAAWLAHTERQSQAAFEAKRTMALLDFIKNRPERQAAPKPAPETQAPQAPPKDVSRVLSPADLAKFREVGARLEKATAHARSPVQPEAGDGGNAALLQKQNNQDRTQAALSPTDHYKGQTVTRKRALGWER
jgi:hypothetical protein